MKIRFKFVKTGRLKYIGHLDLLNVWNRAVKSAKLPVGYSNGFNPHMLISFAAPLPLGLESRAEYVDIDFEEPCVESIAEKINARFPAGLEITGCFFPEIPYKRVAAVVSRAEYLFEMPFDVNDGQLVELMAGPIEVLKKTKRNNSVTDISPDIFSVSIVEQRRISAILSCGSAKNLKPSLFIESFSSFVGSAEPLYKIKTTRTEIFGQNRSGELAPLSECYIG